MERRNFIRLTASAQALMLMPNQVMAIFRNLNVMSCPVNTGKKLVLIQLQGANDGLNTLVPINQYDLYSNLRPNIKLSLTGANKLINLNTTLPMAAQVGLHPALTGFKSLYDSGLMRIVQGVGYPDQDKSHFKSTDLWLTGGDGTAENNNIKSGWMGRFLEKYYAGYLNANYPLGLQFGSSDNSLGFHGAEHQGLSLNLNNQDLNGYFSIINGLGGPLPANIPNSEYGDLLNFIGQNDANTNVYANRITTAFGAGSNTGTYPNTFLGNQLKTVAKLISGGLETKIYLVRISGFDTHDSQVVANETHLGNHANLLKAVSDAVLAFVTDLQTQNHGQDVVTLTFSEFGRKIAQNASLGTDHGEVAPMFLFGPAIQAGISGTNINLSEATAANNYQVETVQHDYRRIFATLMQDWLGASTPTVDYSLFNHTTETGFTTQKVNSILKPAAVVPPNCYGATVTSAEKTKEKRVEVSLFPNPASEQLTISAEEGMVEILLYNLDGREVANWSDPNPSQQVQLSVSKLPPGVYHARIRTREKSYLKKLMVRR